MALERSPSNRKWSWEGRRDRIYDYATPAEKSAAPPAEKSAIHPAHRGQPNGAADSLVISVVRVGARRGWPSIALQAAPTKGDRRASNPDDIVTSIQSPCGSGRGPPWFGPDRNGVLFDL